MCGGGDCRNWYTGRMIGLMDCNNFFVSCERLFRPDLLKKPVAVLSSNDGCIVARSQEIKDLGIPMGIPYFKVKDILKKANATLFSSNFTLYRDISTRVMQTLASEVGPCEIYSIDEAFFEVHDSITADEVLQIRARVMKDVGLPVSIGVAHTKTLAKQASAIAKKGNGACILNTAVQETIGALSCTSVWGLGRQSAVKLKKMGISTIAEFLSLDRAVIRRHFGVGGDRIYSELSGTAVHEFGHNSEDIQQSIMSTRSFEKTTKALSDLESSIGYHVSEVAEKLREKKLVASRISVYILPSRHGDFFLHKGSTEVALLEPTSSSQQLLKEALFAVRKLYEKDVPYKKAGVVVGHLMPETYSTKNLFEGETKLKDTSKLDSVTDSINEKFGHGTLRFGVILSNGARPSAKLRSKEYTTNWKDIPTVRA